MSTLPPLTPDSFRKAESVSSRTPGRGALFDPRQPWVQALHFRLWADDTSGSGPNFDAKRSTR